MPEPSPIIDAAKGFDGREAVPGTRLFIDYRTRGATGELEVVGARAPNDTANNVVAEVAAVIEQMRTVHGEVEFHLAADHPVDSLDALAEAVADAAGLAGRRDLLQLRRPLPVAAGHAVRASAPPLAVRPIHLSERSGDVGAWLRANNRAFARHPDQGTETTQTLARRLAADGADASGFLVADDPERPGELSGFCWTKVHGPTKADPALGEIYVIGVDPSHQGEGLGPSFVLAGLDHLAGRGLAVANLYVDADNDAARRLYDRLGFATHARRRVYSEHP
ncbi:MAG: mycothiol synthase [Acidimicrobiales bacterium]